MTLLARLTHLRALRCAASALGLTLFLRQCYFRLACPPTAFSSWSWARRRPGFTCATPASCACSSRWAASGRSWNSCSAGSNRATWSTISAAISGSIKIDVEGYEHSVLQGLRQTLAQPQCEILSCEIHTSLLPGA